MSAWLEEKSWSKIKGRLPNSHRWGCCFAKREKKKGRAKGGFIIGRKKGYGEDKADLMQEIEEGIVVSRVGGKDSRGGLMIISVYNMEGWRSMEDTVKRLVEENKVEKIIIGGDFNTRIGEKGGNCEEGWDIRRKSKDKTLNSRDRIELIELVGEIEGYIEWNDV